MSEEPVSELIDDRFELGPLIGRGAMGDVYRGRDLRLGREVAIKCLRRDVASEVMAAERFAEEARSAAQLNHPAIVTVYDTGEWRGAPYLVMECLPGRTLGDEFAEGPLDPPYVRRLATDLAAALAAAHQMGVVHRDVKPGNVLLDGHGRAKLADFGIAKSSESMDHTKTGLIIGTPAYLAPERLEGRPATASSDVYALGVVLYEALTGVRPFQADTPIVLAHAVCSKTPLPVRDRNPSVDAELAAVVDAAMARDPDARPTARGVLALLSKTPSDRTGATLAMPRTTTLPQSAVATKWWASLPSRTRRATVVVAAVAVGIVAVVVVGDGGNGDAPEVPVTSAPPASLSQPLDDALVQLEEAVRP